jgi:hypothetical protein
MIDSDIKVINIAEDGRYELNGKRTSWIRLTFFVGEHGPFIERIPKDDYSAATRDEKLNAFAREVRTS